MECVWYHHHHHQDYHHRHHHETMGQIQFSQIKKKTFFVCIALIWFILKCWECSTFIFQMRDKKNIPMKLNSMSVCVCVCVWMNGYRKWNDDNDEKLLYAFYGIKWERENRININSVIMKWCSTENFVKFFFLVFGFVLYSIFFCSLVLILSSSYGMDSEFNGISNFQAMH